RKPGNRGASFPNRPAHRGRQPSPPSIPHRVQEGPLLVENSPSDPGEPSRPFQAIMPPFPLPDDHPRDTQASHEAAGSIAQRVAVDGFDRGAALEDGPPGITPPRLVVPPSEDRRHAAEGRDARRPGIRLAGLLQD